MNWTIPHGTRGLIFDCDGTLVDSMPLHYRSWVAVLERYQIEFPEAIFYEWAGISAEAIIRRLAEDHGLTLDAAAVAAERDHHFHSQPIDQLKPIAVVVEIARRFRGELPMAVATGSTKATAEASLRAIGIVDWFDAVVGANEAARPKPAPDVFLLAAEKIGVEPHLCAAFEDANLGLQAAAAAGMHVVDIRPWLAAGTPIA